MTPPTFAPDQALTDATAGAPTGAPDRAAAGATDRTPDSAPGLSIGPLKLDVPVVLAPMAGITNTAFRRLCREFGAGLYVSEMITSRALVERTPASMRLIQHHESESTRSIQLYGVDPKTVAEAVTMLVAEDRADHIDLNFGCPVPQGHPQGRGSGVAVEARTVPRDRGARGDRRRRHPAHRQDAQGHRLRPPHLPRGRARRRKARAWRVSRCTPAPQRSSIPARRTGRPSPTLKESVSGVPVLGNGDIWSGDDAVRMMDETGCDGVVVGRGCLGRPWLFGDLVSAFEARESGSDVVIAQPSLGTVASTLRRHTELLAEFLDSEEWACRDIRKHITWYFKGYPVGSGIRASLGLVESLQQMDDLLGQLDWDQPYPGEDAEGPRGRAGTPKRPSLPDRWLESRDIGAAHRADLAGAELSHSGG